MAADPQVLRVLAAISVEAAAEARLVLHTMRSDHLDRGEPVPEHQLDLWRLRVDGWSALIDLCGETLDDPPRLAPLRAWLAAIRPN